MKPNKRGGNSEDENEKEKEQEQEQEQSLTSSSKSASEATTESVTATTKSAYTTSTSSATKTSATTSTASTTSTPSTSRASVTSTSSVIDALEKKEELTVEQIVEILELVKSTENTEQRRYLLNLLQKYQQKNFTPTHLFTLIGYLPVEKGLRLSDRAIELKNNGYYGPTLTNTPQFYKCDKVIGANESKFTPSPSASSTSSTTNPIENSKRCTQWVLANIASDGSIKTYGEVCDIHREETDSTTTAKCSTPKNSKTTPKPIPKTSPKVTTSTSTIGSHRQPSPNQSHNQIKETATINPSPNPNPSQKPSKEATTAKCQSTPARTIQPQSKTATTKKPSTTTARTTKKVSPSHSPKPSKGATTKKRSPTPSRTSPSTSKGGASPDPKTGKSPSKKSSNETIEAGANSYAQKAKSKFVTKYEENKKAEPQRSDEYLTGLTRGQLETQSTTINNTNTANPNNQFQPYNNNTQNDTHVGFFPKKEGKK